LIEGILPVVIVNADDLVECRFGDILANLNITGTVIAEYLIMSGIFHGSPGE
jgi:hypothetical protein